MAPIVLRGSGHGSQPVRGLCVIAILAVVTGIQREPPPLADALVGGVAGGENCPLS